MKMELFRIYLIFRQYTISRYIYSNCILEYMSDTQQFITTDDTKVDNTKMITVNLCPGIMPVYKNDISTGYAKTVLQGGYIKIPYMCPGGTVNPNATYVDNLSIKNYKTTNLYIFNKSHIINDISYDAELVIELTPTTNPGDILYLCFLLKCYRDSKKPRNDIDNLINKSDDRTKNYTSTTCNIQPFIDKNQKKIVYKNGINTIIIFTKPIDIKEHDFSTYSAIPVDLFPLFPSDDYIIILPVKEGFQEGFKEGAARGKTAITVCTPINTGTKPENDNSILYTNTDAGETVESNSIFIGIFVTMVICVVSIFVFPPIYFWIMMTPNMDANERIIYNAAFVILLCILAFALMLNGKKHKVKKQILAGAIIMLFVILSICGVQVHTESFKKLDISLSSFIFDTGISRIIQKWTILWKYISVFTLLLFMVLMLIVHFVVKKRKSKELKNKPKSYIDNLSRLILGFGVSYGFVFIALFAFMYTPAAV
jgi:hypothetical protein